MLNAVKAIIFDHDGTLVDSEPVHFSCWNHVLAGYGAAFEFQDYLTHLNGIPSIESARWLIRHCQLSLSAEELYRQKQTQLEAYLATNIFPLMAGARDLVEFAAQAGYALAVASGAGRLEINHSLQGHGLADLLSVTASKNDVANNKPAPDVYLLAAHHLGIHPSQALAIEDSDVGQAAAIAAGMRCFRLGKSQTPHPQVQNFASLAAMQQALASLKASQ